LTGQPVTRVERYQVFDLPEPRMAVTEHRVHVTICPACQAECKGALPPAVSAAPAQYGPRVRALAVYLRVYRLLPYERVSALCGDVFGLPVSKAAIEAAEMEADGNLQPFVEEVAAQVRAAPVAHADETGFRVEGRTRWLHVVATPELTLYRVDDKRGQEAMEAHGILPRFTGRLVHDCWAPYFAYTGCAHALCGAHLLRELKSAHEEQGQTWALEMSLWLLYLAGLRAARSDAPFSAEALAFFEAQYEAILARGAAELPPPPERAADASPRASRRTSTDAWSNAATPCCASCTIRRRRSRTTSPSEACVWRKCSRRSPAACAPSRARGDSPACAAT
jgi:transposase